MALNSSNPRKIKSRPKKSDDGNMEHAETLGGKSTFQATSACNARRSTTVCSRRSCTNSSRNSLQEDKQISHLLIRQYSVDLFIDDSCCFFAVFPGGLSSDGKEDGCRCPSNATRPMRSLMPNCITIVRAISVAFCRSFCAPELAEGARFELAVHEVDAGFQDRWFQPLTHPSDNVFNYLGRLL